MSGGANTIRAVGVALATLVLGCHSPDACDRAFARLDRIETARHQPHLRASFRDLALEACREHGPDPAVHCAMTEATDERAAACIDVFARDVVGGPGAASGAPPPRDGKGLNPLLDE